MVLYLPDHRNYASEVRFGTRPEIVLSLGCLIRLKNLDEHYGLVENLKWSSWLFDHEIRYQKWSVCCARNRRHAVALCFVRHCILRLASRSRHSRLTLFPRLTVRSSRKMQATSTSMVAQQKVRTGPVRIELYVVDALSLDLTRRFVWIYLLMPCISPWTCAFST